MGRKTLKNETAGTAKIPLGSDFKRAQSLRSEEFFEPDLCLNQTLFVQVPYECFQVLPVRREPVRPVVRGHQPARLFIFRGGPRQAEAARLPYGDREEREEGRESLPAGLGPGASLERNILLEG